MSDSIKHECGIALVRLLKPLEYYYLNHGSWMYGLQKLYLLMEKQHNRGQDGAGVVNIKLNLSPGKNYIFRERSNKYEPIRDVFKKVYANFTRYEQKNSKIFADPHWAKENLPFAGELYLGHVRYGTFGKYSIENVHPVKRESNWKTRSLVLAGNFNLTNVDLLFSALLDLGQHPREQSDTVTILEKIGYYLDIENERLVNKYRKEFTGKDISPVIEQNLNIANVLSEATRNFDGGYTIAGMLGHGDAFATRDPWGIRPAFYFHNDEIAVVASERPVIQTVMNVDADSVKEIQPGFAVVISKNGQVSEHKIREPKERKSCSFERIYFSRGSDKDIYNERKKLGELLVPSILKSIDYDIDNTVFSYIPNTAEIAFYGMIKGIEDHLLGTVQKEILSLGDKLNEETLSKIIFRRPRVEKIAIKDIKLRTFITQDNGRNNLVEHVYDITYNTIRKNLDILVVIDDSIVRGTTLKQSILRILNRLEPRKIVIVSSAPQIRYPDCYGIDMAKLSDFVAFEAAIKLLNETGKKNIINEVYQLAKEQQYLHNDKIINCVKRIYEPFTNEQLSAKIAEILKPKNVKATLEIVYQTVENLHIACPESKGDWYFTGNYPTPGGNGVVNQSFINYIEGNKNRAYAL